MLICESAGGQPAIDKDAAPDGHRFALRHLRQAMDLVLACNISMRAAARVFGVCEQGLPPSFWTIRLWILRLGLFELNRPRPVATDWAFIVDTTIAVGQHKALIILGVRLGELQEKGTFELKHQEVVTLAIAILARCDSMAVLGQLRLVAARVGVPRCIISDSGADIKSAISLFQQEHPQVSWVYDITHRLACLLKKQLAADPWWTSFQAEVGRCKNLCRQTHLSHLMPPALRNKARWFNLEPLVNWGLGVLDKGSKCHGSDPKFRKLFGWLAKHRHGLQQAWQMVQMIKSVCKIIKEQGINPAAVELSQQAIEKNALSAPAKILAERISQFLIGQLKLLRPGETLLGSSDIIESVIGKYKSVIERSPLQVITQMVLSVAASTSMRTADDLKRAMESTTTRDVQEWFRQNGQPTPLAKRREILSRQ